MRLIYLSILLVVNSLCAGEIIITNDFAYIENEIEKLDSDSLVLFDVDATLIVPYDAILKPKGKKLFKKLVSGYTERDLFREIRMKAPHALVDNRCINLVPKLHENKIPVIAFTAAPSDVSGYEEPGVWRVEELQKYGFDFSPAFPNLNLLELPKHADQEHFPLYKSGVLYSSFHSKGDILIDFLQKLNWIPKKIVFIDDELEHVQSVVTSLDNHGIPCIGFHYTAANDLPCDLNLEQALFQIDYFVERDIWLSDEESSKLLNLFKEKT